MRFTVEGTELNDAEWKIAQSMVRTGYEFPEDASRVCLTLVHGEEERHAEMPLAAFGTLMITLGLAPGMEMARLAMGSAAIRKAKSELDDGELPDDLSYEEQYGERP